MPPGFSSSGMRIITFFFRDFGGGFLGVISILHEAMDIPARLKDDESDFENSPNGPTPDEFEKRVK
jgi:hypothetical protein